MKSNIVNSFLYMMKSEFSDYQFPFSRELCSQSVWVESWATHLDSDYQVHDGAHRNYYLNTDLGADNYAWTTILYD